MTEHVTIRVPLGYTLPAWFGSASPEDVAVALDLAAQLPESLRAHADRCADRATLTSTISSTVRSALDAATTADLTERLDRAEADAKAAHRATAEEQQLRALAERDRDAAKASLDHAVRSAKQEEALRVRELMQASLESARDDTQKERDAKAQAEAATCAALREKCEIMQAHSEQVMELKARVSELETPIGRGCAGEVDVAQTLRDAGFVVQDTSTGEMKNKGYLDLLIWPEGNEGDMRIAVEVKNRKEVKRENIVAFEEHVRGGLQKGLFDSAMFVSIRAHVKRDAAVALDLYEDDCKRPLIPVTWLGPEKSKHAPPLTQEQLETHALLHACVLEQAHHLRGSLCDQQADDKELQVVRQFVDDSVSLFNDVFRDLGKQAQAIEDLKTNLTSVRVQCIRLFTAMCQVNREVGFLGRPISAPWLATYETAARKVDTHTPAQIWNDCSKMKSVIENTIGKDAMFVALQTHKRSRTE